VTRKIKRALAETLIREEIKKKQVVLFLNWDVSKPEGREKAVLYLADFLEDAGLVADQ
jgi:hypothetical protein